VVPELAERIAGSSDHFRHPGRHPWASINYAACHDGFTLNDVVSYKHKHNQANLEANHDGAHHSVSWNCGHEGPTDDPSIVLLRNRQRRNLLATVLLSQGVPMLQAGDEIGRTQNGNNNAYCQDNETSWLDWTLAGTESDLTDLVKLLIAVRRDNPVFRRTAFLEGTAHPESSLKDVTWFREDGHEMTEEDWQNPHRQTLAVLLDRTGVDLLHRSDDDRDIGRSFLLLFNAGSHTVEFSVPEPISSQVWQVILDTGEETATVPAHGYGRGHVYSLGPTSLALLCDAGRLAKEPER
jgi:glycogen operon protein